MIQGLFRRRSGRVIALGRLVLAASFLFATWIDPSQPVLRPDMAYGLLAFYVAWASALLVLTWRNWWLDFRLAGIAHVVDIAAFGTIVFLTEGYTSPFYTFFVFLLLSAAIRWTWRETALSAILILLVFAAAGAAAATFTTEQFDLQRILIRTSHLTVLSFLLVWFAINQGAPRAGARQARLPAKEQGPPVEAVLRHAAERTGAGRVVLAWWEKEEPWVHVAELAGDTVRSLRAGPGAYGPLLADTAAGRPFLFDRPRERGLCYDPASARLIAFRQRVDPALSEEFRLDGGLVVRIRTDEYDGELFALDIEGLCSDDLRVAKTLGEELSMTFESASLHELHAEAAVNRAVSALARDLHDSVVQVLAGAAFRLEALKSWIRAGKAADPEIDVIKHDLAEEQANVRRYIEALRGGRGALRVTDIGARLADLAERLERRWAISCELSTPSGGVRGPIWMEHEIHQIVREAAANAVRHGGATRLTVRLALDGEGDEDELALGIVDNGRGFQAESKDNEAKATPAAPWSVHQRVKLLGGTLTLVSGAEGSRLTIRIPLGRER